MTSFFFVCTKFERSGKNMKYTKLLLRIQPIQVGTCWTCTCTGHTLMETDATHICTGSHGKEVNRHPSSCQMSLVSGEIGNRTANLWVIGGATAALFVQKCANFLLCLHQVWSRTCQLRPRKRFVATESGSEERLKTKMKLQTSEYVTATGDKLLGSSPPNPSSLQIQTV